MKQKLQNSKGYAESLELLYWGLQNNWASEVSPTLGCSIEISRDILEKWFPFVKERAHS